MEISNKWIVIAFLILIVMVIVNLININDFMPKYAKCEEAFKVINKCGCVPCELQPIFGMNQSCFEVNFTELNKNE